MPIVGHLRRTNPDFAGNGRNVGKFWVELRLSGTFLDGMSHEFEATRTFQKGTVGGQTGARST
jgi:hypothetical protein